MENKEKLEEQREEEQKKTFTKWINAELVNCEDIEPVKDIFTDLQDGKILLKLDEIISRKKLAMDLDLEQIKNILEFIDNYTSKLKEQCPNMQEKFQKTQMEVRVKLTKMETEVRTVKQFPEDLKGEKDWIKNKMLLIQENKVSPGSLMVYLQHSQRLKTLATEIYSHESRIDHIKQTGQNMIDRGKFTTELQQLGEMWSNLKELLYECHDTNLKVYKYLRDAGESERRMSEWQIYLMRELETNDKQEALNDMRKHEQLTTTILNYSTFICGLAYRSIEICAKKLDHWKTMKQRQEKMRQTYASLLEMCSDRKKRFEDLVSKLEQTPQIKRVEITHSREAITSQPKSKRPKILEESVTFNQEVAQDSGSKFSKLPQVMKHLKERHLNNKLDFITVKQMKTKMKENFQESEILKELSSHPKIEIDGSGFRFKPRYPIRSHSELIAFVKQRYLGEGRLTLVEDVLECYKDAADSIEKLVESKEIILLTRGDQKKVIMYNETLPALGFPAYTVPERIKNIYHSISVEDLSIEDVKRALQKLSIKETVDAAQKPAESRKTSLQRKKKLDDLL